MPQCYHQLLCLLGAKSVKNNYNYSKTNVINKILIVLVICLYYSLVVTLLIPVVIAILYKNRNILNGITVALSILSVIITESY